MLSNLSYSVYALKAAALSLPNSALFDGAYCTPPSTCYRNHQLSIDHHQMNTIP